MPDVNALLTHYSTICHLDFLHTYIYIYTYIIVIHLTLLTCKISEEQKPFAAKVFRNILVRNENPLKSVYKAARSRQILLLCYPIPFKTAIKYCVTSIATVHDRIRTTFRAIVNPRKSCPDHR